MKTTSLTGMSDGDLIAEVDRLAAGERDATASLVAHLAELYGRRLHERAGYSSLFTYCMSALRLSESAAYDRMKAAKVARRHPIVLELLASGRINLTTVRLLAPHLTRDNYAELVAAACGKRKRQVQELLARRFPRPDVPSSVRKLPAVASTAVVVPPMAVPPIALPPIALPPIALPPIALPSMAVPSMAALPPAGVAPRVLPKSPPLVVPLSPDRYRVTVTVPGDTCQMLELAQDLLRHAVPSGDPAEVVARALKLLVEDLVKRKFAVTDRSRQRRRAARDPEEPTAEVKRAVYIRDHGRCAFVGTNGRRCGERGFLEFHHVVPRAAGGLATVGNISLRCRAHNGCEVDLFFGPGKRFSAEVNGEMATSDTVASHGCVSGDAFRSRTTSRTTADPTSPSAAL